MRHVARLTGVVAELVEALTELAELATLREQLRITSDTPSPCRTSTIVVPTHEQNRGSADRAQLPVNGPTSRVRALPSAPEGAR